MEKLTEKSLWTNDRIKYIKNVHITEFDMKSGGISVMKEYHLVPDEDIAKLETAKSKDERNIMLGKMQLSIPTLAKALVDGFSRARATFVEENNIPEENILAIKKDALFIIDYPVKKQQLSENILFRPKNTYTSYMAVNDKEIYFSPLKPELDIKGVSQDTREFQKDFLFKDFYGIMKKSEILDNEAIFDIAKKYRSDYLGRRLPIGAYRDVLTGKYMLEGLAVDNADQSFINDIGIATNYKEFVLPFISNLV
jgi:hypothetical protein